MQTSGPYIPSLSNLVFYIDPYNTTKCYPNGSGTTAYNLLDNTAVTLSNISYTNSSFSNAGTGAITSLTSYNPSLTAGFSVMIFLNLTTTQGGFFNWGTINLYAGNLTKMRWETYSAGGDLYSNTNIPYGTNTWTCWTGTFSGVSSAGASGTSSLYYNGVLDNTASVAGTSAAAAAPQVGVQSGPCSGLIGPCALWNVALTASQVRQAFVALKGRYGL